MQGKKQGEIKREGGGKGREEREIVVARRRREQSDKRHVERSEERVKGTEATRRGERGEGGREGTCAPQVHAQQHEEQEIEGLKM